MIVRVLPDVSGLDKEFDYAVPPHLVGAIAVGTMVRVELAHRRVDGWVTTVDPADAVASDELLDIMKVRGIGPSEEVLASAEVIAERFMGRRRSILTMASPEPLVHVLPSDRRHEGRPGGGAFAELHARGGGLIWCAATQDPVDIFRSLARHGSMLVVVPAIRTARTVASALRGSGFSVALMPEDWSQAAAGADVVIGARSTAWAPVNRPASIVIWDEHDEGLTEERVPTWNARDVAIERAQRLGASCFLVSPAPSPNALHWAQDRIYRTTEAGKLDNVKIIDMSADGPVVGSFSSELIELARDKSKTVLCITNSTGVARLLACRQCKAVARCEKCDSVVVQSDDSRLHCESCGTDRPLVCKECNSGAFKNLRRGSARLCTELAKATSRAVAEVTAAGKGEIPNDGPFVAVGTEALLHRAQGADVVAFIDIDSELNSGFYRANEIVTGLVVRAERLVSESGVVLVQTHDPKRSILELLSGGDLTTIVENEITLRRTLNLPPFSVLAKVSGAGAANWFAELSTLQIPIGCDVNSAAGLVRATDFATLRALLESVPHVRGERVRFAIQPVRA